MPDICNYCSMKILNSEATIGDKHFHHECLVCNGCKKSLLSTPFRMRENVLYCDKCFKNVTAVKCAECKCAIRGKNRIEAMGQFYHPRHLVCFRCKSHLVKPLFIKKLVEVNGERINCGFCVNCADALSHTTCSKCEKPLVNHLSFDGNIFIHMDCNNPNIEDNSSVFSPSTTSSESEDHLTPPMQVKPHGVTPSSPLGGMMMYPRTIRPIAHERPHSPTHPYSPYEKRPHVDPSTIVQSTALDHMHNFQSSGDVKERATELANKKMEFDRPEDVMKGFTSEGNVRVRADNYGKRKEAISGSEDEEEREERKKKEREERMNKGFESSGNVQERAKTFGKDQQAGDGSNMEEEEERKKKEREERMNEGFASKGNVQERAKMFGKSSKKEAIDDEEEPAPKDTGFTSRGSVLARASMFGKKQEENEQNDPERTSSSDEEEPAPKDTGFKSRGSVLARASMFGKKQEENEQNDPERTSSSDSE